MPFLSITTNLFFFFFKDFIYLTEREREYPHKQGEQHRERGRGGERGEVNSLLSREFPQGSIPGPWDHDLNQRRTLNQLNPQGAPIVFFKHSEKNPSPYS